MTTAEAFGVGLISGAFCLFVLAVEIAAAVAGDKAMRRRAWLIAIGFLIVLVAAWTAPEKARNPMLSAGASVALVGLFLWFEKLIEGSERNRRIAELGKWAPVIIGVVLLGIGIWLAG